MKRTFILLYGACCLILVHSGFSIVIDWIQIDSLDYRNIFFIILAVYLMFAIFYGVRDIEKPAVWYEEAMLLFLNLVGFIIGFFEMDVNWAPGIINSKIDISLSTIQGLAVCVIVVLTIWVWLCTKPQKK